MLTIIDIDNFLTANDHPYDAGPAPPPGPSLLDDTEHNMLSNFFTTMTTGPFDVPDTWPADFAYDKTGGSLGMNWAEALPPTLEASTTSLSHLPTLPLNTSKYTNNPMGGFTFDSDMLAAASMLSGNERNNMMNFPTQHLFPTSAMLEIAPDVSTHPRIKQEQQSQQQRRPLNHGEARQLMPQAQHTSVFNPEQPAAPVDPHTTFEVQRLRWGSDAGFVDQGYRRPAGIENTEEVTKNLLENMKCLEPQTSTTNTRSTTPIRAFDGPNEQEWSKINISNTSQHHAGTTMQNESENNERPRKRSKIKAQEEDEEESSAPNRLKKQKSASGTKVRRGSSEPASKKPKTPQGNKSARENLTEEQKRTNHILSEQKRRNLIKQGFDDLCELVPELRGGGFSKSAMLLQAADYLDEVIKGNNMLQRQLSELQAINGFMIPR